MKRVVLCQLLRELEELILQLAADQGIEGAEGLVHQEHVGVRGERAGESHPLLHAAGQLGGEAVLEAVELDHGEHALGDLPATQLRLAADLQRIGHVVSHRAVREEGHVLKDHADLPRPDIAKLGFRKAEHILSEQGDGARGRLYQPVDVTHQGRLAASRQAHDAEDLAALDVEGDVGDPDHGIEALEDFRLAEIVAANLVHDLLGSVAEDLPDTFEHDCGRVHDVSIALRGTGDQLRSALPANGPRPTLLKAGERVPWLGWGGEPEAGTRRPHPGAAGGPCPSWRRGGSTYAPATRLLATCDLRPLGRLRASCPPGRRFSPTQVLASSAGSCFSTVMAKTMLLTCSEFTFRLERI